MENLDFECPVCFSIDYDQKIIPECGHSFCINCLDKVTNENQLLCPECRVYCRDTTKLIKNFSVNRQIEKRKQLLPTQMLFQEVLPQSDQQQQQIMLQKQVHQLKQQLMLQQLQIQNLQQVNVKIAHFMFLAWPFLMFKPPNFRSSQINILLTKPIIYSWNLKSKK